MSEELSSLERLNYCLSFALIGPAVAAVLYLSAAVVSGAPGLTSGSGVALLAGVAIVYAVAAGPLALAGALTSATRDRPRLVRMPAVAAVAGAGSAAVSLLIGHGPAAALIGLAAAAGALVCLRIVRRPWA